MQPTKLASIIATMLTLCIGYGCIGYGTGIAYGQSGTTIVRGGQTILGPVDNSGATSTKPSKSGTALPGTCSPSETFIKTDASPANQLYVCGPAANTWTAQGGGASPALTSNAGDSPFYPFGAISFYDAHAMSANTVYLDAFETQVSKQYRKCIFFVNSAAASGKGARCMVYTRASNGDVTVVAKSDGVLVDTTNTKTPAWSSGTLVSGGVLTLPAAQNYYIALVSDGTPGIGAYSFAGGLQYLIRNGWNGSTFTVKGMVQSTSGVTGTGVNVDVGASITEANLNANSDRRLGYVGFLP